MNFKKKLVIKASIATQLVTVSELFTLELMDKKNFKSADVRNYIFNVDDGRTLGLFGTYDVKNLDDVIREERFTKVICNRGGWRSCVATALFDISKHWKKHSHL